MPADTQEQRVDEELVGAEITERSSAGYGCLIEVDEAARMTAAIAVTTNDS